MKGFSEQLDRHDVWRRETARRLKAFGEWLVAQQLLDGGADEGVQRMVEHLRSDKLMVAFVAEYSRGKSELINAVFFAGYGRRIMPASAGRTTMCPTELAYDAGLQPCLRLLPIESRLKPQALVEWRMAPEKWTRVDLDVNDPGQLASAMEKVAETNRVTVAEARALGFWDDENTQDNPPTDVDGRVEVPRWRHALINMAHPLLKQGLVVLDTPGLNAIGAEPELTVNLIPQAQAVVFVLGADTGVTRSDLEIWREHLAPTGAGVGTRLVVLNKIDTLWDELRTGSQIETEITRQRGETARTLELPPDRVIAVSAQKGLLAKVRDDPVLLRASGLPVFEALLGKEMLGERQRVLESTVRSGVARLQVDAQRVIGVRRRELVEQIEELRGLRGKNNAMVRHMRKRIEQEKRTFDHSAASVLAVRSVHVRLLREVFGLLGSSSIRNELSEFRAELHHSGLKLKIRQVYGHAFDNLRQLMQRVSALVAEIHEMLSGSFRKLNTEHGFSLQVPDAPDLMRLRADLDAVERSHLQYLGVRNLIQLTRSQFTDKLTRALMSRVRAIFETALGEIELWNKSTSSQLDTELRERRRAFTRRIEAIQRVQDAAGGLDARLDELHQQESALQLVEIRLTRQVRDLQLSTAFAAPAEALETATA